MVTILSIVLNFWNRIVSQQSISRNMLSIFLINLLWQNMDYQPKFTIKIERRFLEMVLSVGTSLNHFKLRLYLFLISRYLSLRFIIFYISMQSQQKQLYIKDIEPVDLKGIKKPVSIFENVIQYGSPQKNVQIYIPHSYLALKKTKRIKAYKFHWKLQENILYKIFLKQNINLLESDFHDRMVSKINVLMSQCIKTKTFKQCRSHHQKMMITHKNVAKIIQFIEDLQNKHSPFEISLRKQGEGLQRLIENGPALQMNEEVMEGEGIEMVEAQPKIQQPQQVPILAINDIYERKIDVKRFSSAAYDIQDYFQPDVWVRWF